MIATGVQYSVRDFIRKSAARLGVTVAFEGQGEQELAVVKAIEGKHAPALKVEQVIGRVDPRYFRPTEVETLLGDPAKAKAKLGWTPKITFDELVAEMVREDLKAAERDELIKKHGYKALDYHE